MTPAANFGDHQLSIYVQGMFQNTRPEITTDLSRLESQAAANLSAEAMGYIVPSAGSGATARANLAAFDRWRLAPRMLRGSAERDLSCTVLGTKMAAPVVIAPVGVQTLAHPDGELAMARAAQGAGALDRWAAAWETLQRLPREVEQLNLDRADALYTALGELRRAAQT